MVIGLGTVIGKLLAESGGAVVVSQALVRALGERRLDWALLFSGFIIGLPVFFQVGLVLLAPVLFTLTPADRDCRCCVWASRSWRDFPPRTVWCRRTPARWRPSNGWARTRAARCSIRSSSAFRSR